MESKKAPLVSRQYVVPFVLIISLFFLWGFAHAILDVLNKHFQDALVMSKTHSALVQVMLYSGYFVMAIPAFHTGRMADVVRVLFVLAFRDWLRPDFS